MKKITMRDIANAAGCSLAMVSRVVNHTGYVSEDKRAAVQSAIEELGYIVHKSTKQGPQEKLIGLILRKLTTNFFYYKLTSALMQAADHYGYHTIAVYGDNLDNQNLLEHVKELLRYNVGGIVIGGFGEDYLEEGVQRYLRECGVPVTFIERTAGCVGFNRVQINNPLGTREATRYLIQAGHKKILYINRDRVGEVDSGRLEGFLSAINEVEHDRPAYIVKACPDNNAESGYLATKEAFATNPDITGILNWFDGYAVGALQYLYEIKKRVPDDVEVIGHDDTYAPMLAPPISSVKMPIDEMAYAAISMVIENQNSSGEFFAKTIMLDPKLILR